MNYDYEIALSETRQRLRHWGAWCRSIMNMGLGFSSKSVVGQLCDNQGVMIRATNDVLAPEDIEAEEIDMLVNEYGKEHVKQAKVLLIHYSTDGPIRERILRSQLPRRTYYYYLSNAEKWIHNNV